MKPADEKVCNFDDEAKQEIIKYNMESNESEDDNDDEGKQVVSYAERDNDSYFESSSLNDGEERKRCGRIVCSVVKELFKNKEFFRKSCRGNENVFVGNSSELKLQCFSGEIRNFLQKDYKERLKLLNVDNNERKIFH